MPWLASTARIDRPPSEVGGLRALRPAMASPVSPAYPPQHLLIRLFDLAQIFPEPILVQRLPRLLIPEPARVGRDLIGENQLPLVHAKFELEIHQDHPPGLKKRYQQRIDPRGPLLDVPQHVRIGKLHEPNMVLRDQGIAQLVVLVVELYDRGRDLVPFLEA